MVRRADAIAADLRTELEGVKRQLENKANAGKRQVEILQSKLRSQASEIDRLEAENSELRLGNNVLQSEVTRLKRAQRTNVQDLAHIAAWLVSLANAKGIALDSATLDILNRRGWNPSKRQAGAARR
jgi:predicted nuclease with TOPRIM domain